MAGGALALAWQLLLLALALHEPFLLVESLSRAIKQSCRRLVDVLSRHDYCAV